MLKRSPYAAWANAGLDAWRLGLDASTVIGMRVAKVARGGVEAEREAALMVTEKVNAAWELQADLMLGRHGTTPLSGARGALSHYRRKVLANKRRLSKRG